MTRLREILLKQAAFGVFRANRPKDYDKYFHIYLLFEKCYVAEKFNSQGRKIREVQIGLEDALHYEFVPVDKVPEPLKRFYELPTQTPTKCKEPSPGQVLAHERFKHNISKGYDKL